jgi:hypothetical protein
VPVVKPVSVMVRAGGENITVVQALVPRQICISQPTALGTGVRCSYNNDAAEALLSHFNSTQNSNHLPGNWLPLPKGSKTAFWTVWQRPKMALTG